MCDMCEAVCARMTGFEMMELMRTAAKVRPDLSECTAEDLGPITGPAGDGEMVVMHIMSAAGVAQAVANRLYKAKVYRCG